jgi:hypothetical protein
VGVRPGTRDSPPQSDSDSDTDAKQEERAAVGRALQVLRMARVRQAERQPGQQPGGVGLGGASTVHMFRMLGDLDAPGFEPATAAITAAMADPTLVQVRAMQCLFFFLLCGTVAAATLLASAPHTAAPAAAARLTGPP